MPPPAKTRMPRPRPSGTGPERRPAPARTPAPAGPTTAGSAASGPVAARPLAGNAAVASMLQALPPGAPVAEAGRRLAGGPPVARPPAAARPTPGTSTRETSSPDASTLGASAGPAATAVSVRPATAGPAAATAAAAQAAPTAAAKAATAATAAQATAAPAAAQAATAPAADAAAPAGRRAGAGADPKFQALATDVRQKKRRMASSHPPARAEAAAAGAAAKQPADHRVAEGKAAQADNMDAAKPREFDRNAFVQAVEKAIAARAPQNLEQADEFAESGKAAEVKGEVQGQVEAGKATSAGEIAATTAAGPDTSGVVDKQVVPLESDRPPGPPGRPDPRLAVPDPAPAAATDFSAGPRRIDQQMADAQVTEPQLATSNEPQFTGALDQRKTAGTHSAEAPGRVRADERATLAEGKAAAGREGAEGMAAIAADRRAAGQQVAAGKGKAQSSDEQKQAAVTALLQRVFDATKKDVEDILTGLDHKVDSQFTEKEKAARDAFTAEHRREMDAYKDRRYSGGLGWYRWGRDKLLGLPKEADDIFVRARAGYVRAMRGVIESIADLIAAELARAKQRIAQGRTELQAAIDKLPADQKAIAREAAAEFTGRFDDLAQSVDDKGTELVDTLATKYSDALKAVDDEIAAEKEKNKGLVAKAIDAVKGVIKTILELKDLLLGVLAKAAQAVMLILKDPIGFLRNLVSAVGAGLKGFLGNIWKHLLDGMLTWLLGAAAQAGLQIPQKLDAKSLLLMMASLLGLTIQAIRGRIVKKLPKPMQQAIGYIETAVPILARIAREGVVAVWDDIKTRVGDLKKNLFENIATFLVPEVLKAGIMWIISLLNPASAFIRACKLIIDIVRFIVERGKQIIEFVNAVLDAVIAIARGGSGGVPALIEKALARSIPVLIGVLAAILGLGGIPARVKGFFTKLAGTVGRALDWVIDKIVTLIKKAWTKIKAMFSKGRKGKKAHAEEPDKSAKIAAGLAQMRREQRKRLKQGKLTRQAADQVAGIVKRSHPVFKSFGVVDGGKNWDYRYSASPEEKAEGADKATELTAEEAHNQVMSEAGDRRRYLEGHGSHAQVEATAAQTFSNDVRNAVDAVGYADDGGDHSDRSITVPGTGIRQKGTDSEIAGKDNWVPDHQPPVSVVRAGAEGGFRFYPHSATSRGKQAGTVTTWYVKPMKKLRNLTDKWAEGVKSAWFWK
ncbi:hypothetical protein ACTI_60530 [Actinoplanes sp. OR16]|uniref:phage tail protein n=1 Tax=Actinoplanes sp. OR16 TaxID=946334 RepID=UPI000F6E2914|nr:hypothetical protein [Actinoplanes sp. OR16]BBH69368.1 hypothetical protein ACTI_60530 [Actinoplanes sp. OR16]